MGAKDNEKMAKLKERIIMRNMNSKTIDNSMHQTSNSSASLMTSLSPKGRLGKMIENLR